MINVKNINFTYPNGFQALHNINMSFPDNHHILAILGESGSGKTTLLRCLGKLITPQEGEITINNKSIYDIDNKTFRRLLGIVFQRLYLFPHLDVMRNITLAPVKVHHMEKKETRKKAEATLERLGLQDLAHSYPTQLSGGQAQRIAIARALILEPEYLLLDEPTSALDIRTTREFGDWLLDLKDQTRFIIVTHDIEFAKYISAESIFIENGKVLGTGHVQDVHQEYFEDNTDNN
jgi:ABC-type polar amino acid transport system ATPase subunit